ncbi:hypothetical protein M8C21_023890, partial [Ambrosia artemisiifolia]
NQQENMLSAKVTCNSHGQDSSYFLGWEEYEKNPYDEALVKFMSEIRGGSVSFDPNNLVLTAGATSANETLMFCLANPGDAFLIPTPYYPGFDRDLKWRTGAEIVPIQCSSLNGFRITKSALEEAYKQAQKQNLKVKGILVTNPSNPLGTSLSLHELDLLVNFISSKNIHLVSDEIYSGTRVVSAATKMSSFGLVSSQTQYLLSEILSNQKFTTTYLSENRRRLKERHEMVVNGLKRSGIACLPSNSGLFCWVDMSHLLSSNTFEGEMELWKKIVYEVRLNISPGSSCHCSEPGWFRVCFANMSEETLELAMQRVKSFVDSMAKQNNVQSRHQKIMNRNSRRTKSLPKWVFELSYHQREIVVDER